MVARSTHIIKHYNNTHTPELVPRSAFNFHLERLFFVLITRYKTWTLLTDSCTWAGRDAERPRCEEECQFGCRCRSGGTPDSERIMSCLRTLSRPEGLVKAPSEGAVHVTLYRPFSTISLCPNTGAGSTEGLGSRRFVFRSV